MRREERCKGDSSTNTHRPLRRAAMDDSFTTPTPPRVDPTELAPMLPDLERRPLMTSSPWPSESRAAGPRDRGRAADDGVEDGGAPDRAGAGPDGVGGVRGDPPPPPLPRRGFAVGAAAAVRRCAAMSDVTMAAVAGPCTRLDRRARLRSDSSGWRDTSAGWRDTSMSTSAAVCTLWLSVRTKVASSGDVPSTLGLQQKQNSNSTATMNTTAVMTTRPIARTTRKRRRFDIARARSSE